MTSHVDRLRKALESDDLVELAMVKGHWRKNKNAPGGRVWIPPHDNGRGSAKATPPPATRAPAAPSTAAPSVQSLTPAQASAARPLITPGTLIYQHPQGSVILVFPGGNLTKIDRTGKRTSTSATAAKLAAGHGAWKQVGAANANTTGSPGPQAAPAPAAPPPPPQTPAPPPVVTPTGIAVNPGLGQTGSTGTFSNYSPLGGFFQLGTAYRMSRRSDSVGDVTGSSSRSEE